MSPGAALFASLAVGGLLVVVRELLRAGRQDPAESNPVMRRMENYLRSNQSVDVAVRSPARSLISILRSAVAFRGGAGEGTGRRKTGRRSRALADRLEAADFKLRPSEWVLILAGIGLVLGLAGTLRFSLLVGVAVGALIPPVAGELYLRRRRKRRAVKFAEMLPEVIVHLANSLKAGHSFAQAMASVPETAGPPIGPEFALTMQQIQLGLPFDDAVGRLVERNHSDDLDLAMTAVSINRLVGGNLAEILETIAETIRERVHIVGEIRTLTAQARTSGWIVGLLPVALGALLTVIAPDYFSRIFAEPAGWVMIGAGLVSLVIGAMIIRRISAIDV